MFFPVEVDENVSDADLQAARAIRAEIESMPDDDAKARLLAVVLERDREGAREVRAYRSLGSTPAGETLQEDDERRTWISKDGTATPMSELHLSHLLNCILMLERKARADGGDLWELILEYNETFQALLAEAEARRLPLPHMFNR